MAVFFNPAARKKQDTKLGMSHFYAMQLKEANKAVDRLRENNTQLREEMNLLRLGEQSRMSVLQQRINELRFENEALKNKLEMIQMRYNMMSRGPMFASQPSFPHGNTMSGHMTTSNTDNSSSSNIPIDPTI